MKKYLITVLGRYGDLILTTPVFEAIKKFDSKANITVITGRNNYQIIENNPYIDRIIVFNKNPLKIFPFILKLKLSKYDFYIDVKVHYSKESRFIAKMVKAYLKIGFNNPNLSKVFDIDFTLDKPNEITHFTSNSLWAISKSGIKINDLLIRPNLFQNDDSKEYVKLFLISHGITNFSLLNISATSENRLWPINKWNELVISTNLNNKKVIVTFAPENKVLAQNLSKLNKNLILFKSRKLSDVISICAKADEIITPDTSLVHIASAFDKPLLALYNGLEWNYKKFHPTSSNFVVIRSDKDSESINGITTQEVIEGYNKLQHNS